MISAFTALVSCLILIPTIPLVLYAIGLLLPASHIISRSYKYNTTAEILWAILTSVEDYPVWRSNIDRINVRRDEFEDELNKYDNDRRLTFVEYTKKDRRTVVMHIEQEHERKLLRVLEERPSLVVSERIRQKSPTFSGSWTFTLEPVEGERAVMLKITEQGVIKKPMVRVSHMLFFGYHRRIDRFMKDLAKEVELGILDNLSEHIEESEEHQSTQEAEISQTPLKEIVEEEEEDTGIDNKQGHSEHDEYEAGPDDSILLPVKKSMSESKLLDKEWDMMSEIYDKKSLA
ncbi:hypothetical protein A0J61_02199 [Choanephora cucurbitarum]|uniref:Uncharacterized protein n=1 Tax=Choanephora cucurbitarum TaxID=101091 RepID=A0A1C7NKT8_9FUNG|nr:hypothetical protein A0J61_02199 [Choanephora cucurbitarum]